MAIITHQGDAVKWARKRARATGPAFHALFCDAPYEMDFMGKDWDGSGVSFDPDTWEAFARLLFPGAFLFVSAGTINDDLISVAMRKAGLRKFHKVMGWAYGSGFPKASRVNHGSPKTEIFSGHRYGLQALKPAIETILVFQKPYNGKPIDNITETGAGALNIDGGRIEGIPWNPKITTGLARDKFFTKGERPIVEKNPNLSGRWPSNLILLDEGAARALDEQSGELKSGGRSGASYSWKDKKDTVTYSGEKFGNISGEMYSDSGGASRFFFQVSEQIDEADPVFYSAKTSRKERDAGLEGFEDTEIGHNRFDKCAKCGGYLLQNPDRPSACRCEDPIRKNNYMRNPHPTVKPLSLCKYLATLLLPPIEYAPRRLFVPFAGVGSEQIGAHLAGWEEIEGVELTKEYIPINEARVKYWQKRGDISRKPKNSLPENVKNPNQLELI